MEGWQRTYIPIKMIEERRWIGDENSSRDLNDNASLPYHEPGLTFVVERTLFVDLFFCILVSQVSYQEWS